MTLANFDVVFYTSIFVLPGFLIKEIINSLSPPKKSSDGIYFLSCMVYSICNCAVWSWLYNIIYSLHINHPNWYWVLIVLTTILGAILFALIVGIVKQKHLISKLLRKSPLNFIDSTPTAWDYYFSKQKSAWIIVTLKDDKTVYGLFSDLSFASSEQEERDIYIEEIYDINGKNEWVKDERTDGIYIPKDMIKTIEFLK